MLITTPVCRAPFVPQMCASLTKLGLPTNAPLDNRRLALDVASTLILWEQQRLSGPPALALVGCLPCSCQSKSRTQELRVSGVHGRVSTTKNHAWFDQVWTWPAC